MPSPQFPPISPHFRFETAPPVTELFHQLTHVPLVWVYLIIFFSAFIENIFPPAPSDVAIVIGGAVVGLKGGSAILAILSGALGSTLGFMTMYIIGSWLSVNYIERRDLKYFPKASLHKVEAWFEKYGFWIIIVNRFLSGTRAVVSFFAGMSQLNFARTTALSFVSSVLWYALLVYGGFSLGRKWQRFEYYMETYSRIITIIMVVAAILAAAWYFWNKQRKPKA